MTGFKQITNAQGAFGYGEQADNDPRGPVITRRVHNMSSVNPIRAGNAVVFSTLSTDGTGVVVSTVINSYLFAGVAITPAGLGQTTHLTSRAPSSAFCDIVISGPVYAHLDTAVVNGDIVSIGNTTLAGGTSNGGQLDTFTVSTVAGTQAIAGIAHTSGSTLAPDGVTTQNPRGYVTIMRSFIGPSTL